MKTRLAGLVLIVLGVLSAVFFVYLPMQGDDAGPLGRTRTKALVFVPLAIVTGLAFAIGGPPALEAFQARPKSRSQLAFVLGLIIGSGLLTGLGYWQLKKRAPRPPELEVIRDFPPQVPQVANPEFKPK